MSVLRKRKVKLYCGRCHDRCDSDEYKTCEGCLRVFHNKCLLKSKKYTKTSLKNTQLFFCSKKCECSIFPFNLVRDKEFSKLNAYEIKEPCSQCGGNVTNLIEFNVTNAINGCIYPALHLHIKNSLN